MKSLLSFKFSPLKVLWKLRKQMQFLAKVFHHHLHCHRHVKHLVVRRIVCQNRQMTVLLYSEVFAILTRLDYGGLQMDTVRNVRYIYIYIEKRKKVTLIFLFQIWRDCCAMLNKEPPLLD